jgi:DNA-binding response OmpR family regulator
MKKKILIIDDDTAISESLKMLLTVKGYEVDTASDGLEGLEKVKSAPPDLVVLDLFLPEMNGPEVYANIRKNESTAALPVLFLSSFSEKPDILDDANISPDLFMPKPIDPIGMLNRIASILET